MTTYRICVRCAKFIESSDDINYIESGREMVVFWCNDCVTKHLNSSGDNK